MRPMRPDLTGPPSYLDRLELMKTAPSSLAARLKAEEVAK
jgi:hypothetical protein